MTFRFSRDNVVGWVGVTLCGVTSGLLAYRIVAGWFNGSDGPNSLDAFFLSLPWWPFVIAVVIAFVIAIIGGSMNADKLIAHDKALAKYARKNRWAAADVPEWVWAARTFPLDGSKELAPSHAHVGDAGGYWGAVFTVDNEAGPMGIKVSGIYQIVGLPFDGDMPRVHLIPRDTVEATREMAGGHRIDFESAAFNAQWRVRGSDAKRVHDILHPRTLERLLKPDALGQPIIIDGGAIWTWRATPVYGGDFEAVLTVLRDVATAIPAFVYKDLNVRLLVKRTDDIDADRVTSRGSAGVAERDENGALEEA